MKISAMLLCDFYKIGHRPQYPEKTEVVYSTWTQRISRIEGVTEGVVAGTQRFTKKYLIDFFNENFFWRPLADVVSEYQRIIKFTLGAAHADAQHIVELHNLGYLPLEIKSLPEGMVVPLRVPHMTIKNTIPKFFWLTNYVESLASCELWKMSTSATTANEYRKVLNRGADLTVGNRDFVPFQMHDFSFRGMSGLDDAATSGIGHLFSAVGTDSIPSIIEAERYYNANVEKELVGTSIPATEHSVMCANKTATIEQERAAFKRLVTKVYPNGFVSIVSDTVDFWAIVSDVIPSLKAEIMARDGRVVIRPDSGDPVKIMCGDPASENEYVRKGLIECLWDIFGGTTTEKGYRLLDSHVGAIYGEAITLGRAREITQKLMDKKFASINAVFGIGSYTYQYVTRDTLGFAYKSTCCVTDGEETQLFKNPKTDDGTKKSQKGCVAVLKDFDGKITYVDQLSLSSSAPGDLLRTVFLDGKLLVDESLATIRSRLAEHNALIET